MKLAAAAEKNRQGNFAASLQLAEEVLKAAPQDREALAICLDANLSLGQSRVAADCARKLAEIDPENAATLLVRAFDWHLKAGFPEAAETDLRQWIDLKPDNPSPYRMLAQLQSAQGRRFEASEQMLEAMRRGPISRHELLSLIDRSGPYPLVSYEGVVDMSTLSLFNLGEARTLYIASAAEVDDVLPMVRQVRAAFPNNAAAAAFEGRLLAEDARMDSFSNWFASLPSGIDGHPEYWNALGRFLSLKEMHEQAVRCYGEAIRLDPTDRSSLRQMVQSLDALKREKQAVALRDRLKDLDQIFRIAKNADSEQARWIAERMQSMMRMWESTSWSELARLGDAAEFGSHSDALSLHREQIREWENSSTIAKIEEHRLGKLLGFQIDTYPLPAMGSLATLDPATIAKLESEPGESSLRLVDIASEVGIDRRFQNDFPLHGELVSPSDVNGGGIAVLDFDLDGWCDLYFAQSGGKPVIRDGSAPNELFRHLRSTFAKEKPAVAGGRFVDVTVSSGTGDRGFGQGVCSGDINQDGFPDLIVGNFGPNVIYLNQGDGTFVDVSDRVFDRVDRWTSSVAVADLDGDHLPEIIDVNYIDDPRVLEVECVGGDLRCQPQQFTAATDRIYQNQGNGEFRVWSGANRLSETRGRGFATVIANFDRQHGNDVFVSNDIGQNHFWSSMPDRKSDSENQSRFQVVESAAIRGCGIGPTGDTQGCMGVASGDFDRNGMLDLHVTNFHHESVNLFLQNRLGYFSDEALRFGLSRPSYTTLGFGTQGVDLDNDGWVDLAVLNGHVFDERGSDVPFRMPPQIFRGSPTGMTLTAATDVGPFFQTPTLGRTLAMLDWNRDGKVDLFANHLDAPVALLQNESAEGHWVQFELIGTTSERDAIGAEVVVQAGDVSLTGWQIGGDGYMCTNEPIVHFGLGTVSAIDDVTIHWPSGQETSFGSIEMNRRYRVIEGSLNDSPEPSTSK
ncbi:FG-GAP-like repeat-containing protein [Novipirellula herctigrandis]